MQMITKEEALKRIELWGGDYYQEKFKRIDGKEFMITTLWCLDDKQTKRTVDTFTYPC